MAKAFGVTVIGDRAVMMRLGLVGKHAPHDLAKAMVRKGEEIIGDAKEITPVDTGALRGSGHVQPPRMTPAGVDVDIGFGGPSVDYALAVHERGDLRHKPPTGYKFLERAIQKHLPSMVSEFRRKLNAAIAARFGVIN